jgi:hypothetical protein
MQLALPELLVVSDLIVGILWIAAFLVMLGIAIAYRHTFGWFLEHLADVIGAHVPLVGGAIGRGIDTVNNEFLTAITAGAAKSQHIAGRFFHAAAIVQGWIAREMMDLARDSYEWAQYVQHVLIPKAMRIGRVALPWGLITTLIYKIIRHLHLHNITKIVNHWVRTVPHVAAHAAAKVAPAVMPFPRWVPWLRHRVIDLWHWRVHVNHRLHRLERLLGVTAFAVAMANVLGLPNWRCLTRGNMGRFARKVCATPWSELETLFGLALDFLLLENICQVLPLLEEAFTAVAAPLISLLAAAGAGLCDASYAAGPPLPIAQLQVPTVQYSGQLYVS